MEKIKDFFRKIFYGNKELTEEEEHYYITRLIEKIKES